jgi:ERCC4-related helicase
MQFVDHPWINPGAIEKRMYQEDIVKTALAANTLCVIPTGLGKTNIAALVAACRMDSYPDKKILFLAPTRPLVNQHKNTFERFLKTGLELKVITGFNKPEERKELYNTDVVFSTPQTIGNDLKRGIIKLTDYSLLIIDEAHRAIGNYAYPYVAKLYMLQSRNPLILALTASPGSFRNKINEVKQKLFIRNVEIRTREDSDVKPYVQKLKQGWIEVELPPELKEIKSLFEKVKEERINKLLAWRVIQSPMVSKSQIIKRQQELAKRKTGMSFAAMSLLAAVLKIDHALTLLETQCLYSLGKYLEALGEQNSRAVARLMKDDNFISAVRLTKKLLEQNKEHPKIEKLKEVVSAELERDKYCNIIIFIQFRDTISRVMEALREIPLAAPIEFIGQSKKRGKGLSQKEQIEILNEFKLGFYNILLATQIGEEGLDIEETSLVIFYEPTPSAIRKIQRTGRTARTKPGKVLVLLTKGTRDEAYHWSGHHKERRMKRMLQGMQKQRELSEFSLGE